MKFEFVKVGAAVPRVYLGDPAHNAEELSRVVRDAAKSGVELLVFPELCLTGATLGDLFFQNALLDGAHDALITLARETAKLETAFVVGLPMRVSGAIYNCAAVVHRGEICGLVPKSVLDANERRWFSSGAGAQEGDLSLSGEWVPFGVHLLFDAGTTTFAVSFGAELLAPVSPVVAQVTAGAQVVLVPGAASERVGRFAYLMESMKNLSARTASGIVYAGAGDGESTTDVVFGETLALFENGDVLNCVHNVLEPVGELTVNDLDLDRLTAARREAGLPRVTEEFETVTLDWHETSAPLTRVIPRSPFIPEEPAELAARCDEIFSIQAAALKARLRHTGVQNAVVAVSGGLDSTLALLVTVRAFDTLDLPRSQITAITMPGFGTTDRTYDNAMGLMRGLGVTVREISIKDACLQHFAVIGHDPERHDVVYENAQARERTQIAMDVANQIGGLHIGTGDLSEFALGWATYSGDHMSMYAVNAAVPKTLMRHMVAHVAGLPGYENVRATLLDIIDTPISPELLPTDGSETKQKTEGIVGPYELHDFFVYYVLRYGYSPEKIYSLACRAFVDDYDAKEIKRWLKMFYRRFFAQQFKRSCAPDGPGVGSVGFSPRGGWVMPSDAISDLWLHQVEGL